VTELFKDPKFLERMEREVQENAAADAEIKKKMGMS
jgi:hypothetical protein